MKKLGGLFLSILIITSALVNSRNEALDIVYGITLIFVLLYFIYINFFEKKKEI